MSLSLPTYNIVTPIYATTSTLIFRAQRHAGASPVIIKTLPNDYPTSEQQRRLRHEYAMLQAVLLPGVIRALMLEEDYSQRPLLILEDVGGTPLTEFTRQLALDTLLTIACALADTLAQIHVRQIVHRDINPSNVIFNPSTGALQIIDFGLALPLAEVGSCSTVEGTLPYLAPEQTGRTTWPIDQRTDLYALGCTLYELVSGAPPFAGQDALEVVHAHLAALPPPLPATLPAPLAAMIVKLLAKHPDERYQTAAGLLADLREAQRQWTATGTIVPFALGTYDHAARLVLSGTLYGREHEQQQLAAVLEQVRGGQSALVLVAGEGGSGKSALVQTLVATAAETRFVRGKFDQIQRSIPYAALAEACTMLLQQLLALPGAQLAATRARLLNEVGANLGVLVEVLPMLRLIVGDQPSPSALGLQETQNRFLLTFYQFLSVVASPHQPLIIFLDDLQWGDSGSLLVLQVLTLRAAVPGLLLIGAYRESEIDAEHPLSGLLDELDTAAVIVEQMQLNVLQLEDVGALIGEALQQETSTIASLADIVYAKTEGNPLFVRELLQSLVERKLLYIDSTTRQWCWELSSINAQGLTDNVVMLLTRKLRHLSAAVQHLLMVAAAVGNTVEAMMIAHLADWSPAAVEQGLWDAVAAGLLVADSRPGVGLFYRFVHDRVQEAAYGLIPELERSALHAQIGRYRLMQVEGKPSGADLFDITAQLNSGRKELTAAEQVQLTMFNLRAGQQALASAAYGPALTYFDAGIQLLSVEAWGQQYKLAISLYQGAGEAALLTGTYDMLEQYIFTVQKKARNDIDRARMIRLRIEADIARNQHAQAIPLAIETLQLLGVNIPKQPKVHHVVKELLQLRLLLNRKNVNRLTQLPMMIDPKALTIVEILGSITAISFLVAPNLLPLIIATNIRIALKYGNLLQTAQVYATYGMITASIFGDIESGYLFGKVALQVSDTLKINAGASATYLSIATFTQWLREPYRDVIHLAVKAQQIGIRTGDFRGAGFAAVVSGYFHWAAGYPLKEVSELMDANSLIIRKINQELIYIMNAINQQFVANLLGEVDDPCMLVGAAFDERVQVGLLINTNTGRMIYYINFYKLILGYVFNNARVAQAALEAIQPSVSKNKGDPNFPLYICIASLALLGQIQAYQGLRRRRILWRVAKQQRLLAKYARYAPMNFLHMWHLVEGERNWVDGNRDAAQLHYQQAATLAHQHTSPLLEGLAYERMAHCLREQGNQVLADSVLAQAYDCYKGWGAEAKVRQLEQQFPQLRVSKQSSATAYQSLTSSSAFAKLSGAALDLTSILKAGEAITRQIELPKLGSTLLHLVCENAGADSGLLLLDYEGRWLPFGEAADQQPLPQTVLSYVARTHEPVVLADALQTPPFSQDPNMLLRGPRSLACVPLINQGKLTALLYLENSLLPTAFTPERIEIVQVLASQAAIALENARLYQQLTDYSRTLEHQVAERTLELEKARQVAEDANHLKSQFLANMSHELRTPLNAIINFTEFTMDEDYGPLTDQQRQFQQRVLYNSEHLLGLINDILDLSKIESGKLDLRIEEAELLPILEGVMATAIGLTAEKGLGLRLDVQVEPLPPVWIDKQRVRQILLNLLSNAAKFTEAGGITVCVDPCESGYIQVRVIDTGIGIPPESQVLVFEEFRQISSDLSRTQQGTGLGLPISKRLVEMHGGRMWLESTPGVGSTFAFTLPLQPVTKLAGSQPS